MFGNILVYAGSRTRPDPAVAQAMLIAERTGARLEIIDVVRRSPPRIQGLDALRDLIREKCAARLEALAADLPDEGLGVQTRILSGRPCVSIARHISERGHDLLLTGAAVDDRSALRETRRLLRTCPCPVWVVRGFPTRSVKRILAAVEPAPPATEAAALGAAIMKHARALADLVGAEIDTISSWNLEDDDARAFLPEDAYAELEVTLEESARRLVASFLASLERPVPEPRVHLAGQLAIDAILDGARRHQADLIVMGTVGRRGLAGLLLGNTAESVLRRSPCSILAVKTDSFVAPFSVD